MNKPIICLSLALSFCFAALTGPLDTTASAATTLERLQAVENKTRDFTIRRAQRTRTVKGLRFRSQAATLGLSGPLGVPDGMVSLITVPMDMGPRIGTFWLDLTITYTANRNFQFALIPSLIGTDYFNQVCTTHFELPAAAVRKTVRLEGLCQGLVNRPEDKTLHVVFFPPFNLDLSIPSATLDVRVVNEVLVKPDF